MQSAESPALCILIDWPLTPSPYACDLQKQDVADDLDATFEEFQQWLQDIDTGLTDLRRELSKTNRDIVSKKQLIEANKAQYTKVRSHNAAMCHELSLFTSGTVHKKEHKALV